VIPIAASILILGAGGYALNLGPAVTGTAAASKGWLGGLLGGGNEPEAVVEAVPETPPAGTKKPATKKPATGQGTGGVGTLAVNAPEGAQVIVDGRERGTAPLELTDLAAGEHALELRSDSGTIKRTVRVRAGGRTVSEETIAPGYVSILAKVPLEIYLGSRRIGSTEDDKIQLPAGSHRLTVVNTRYAFRAELPLEVKPGEVTAFTATLPSGRLIVNTASGAEILIEGESMGMAPLGELEVPVGTREILVRHADYGEKRVTLEIKRNETAQITVALGNTSADARPATPRLAPLSAPPAPRPR
jgi:hypothetical protein